jgi:hypothetical protein
MPWKTMTATRGPATQSSLFRTRSTWIDRDEAFLVRLRIHAAHSRRDVDRALFRSHGHDRERGNPAKEIGGHQIL